MLRIEAGDEELPSWTVQADRGGIVLRTKPRSYLVAFAVRWGREQAFVQFGDRIWWIRNLGSWGW